ncbi:flagellar hook-associated protein FlgL [Sporohalobacter salinus]|uniref:flagellar hook-associated protein FlgL n=1 Tax=Sporohalobacter salinus TaxID=1494606 RepID=UPI001961BC1C|nr:flagellar hook-associated protein FlgL [Sporohalobacter salinus]MBM7623031.1 flagellar hook-associated protein 3 FlgL [Sporohalobacter salinus]
MRVTNGMMVNNLLGNISDSRERLDEYNRQLSTGKQFNRPSQDPTGTVRSMRLSSNISNNEQLNRNIDQAMSWMGYTESALKDANKIVQQVRELTVRGANDSLSSTDRNNIADEVEELGNNLAEIANSTYQDNYIFAGNKVEIKPYQEIDPDKADFGYRGNKGKLNRKITEGTQMSINQNGAFFEDIFKTIDKLEEDLRTGSIKNNSDARLNELDQNLDTVIRKRSEIGAKYNRLESTQSRLEDNKVKLKKLLSKNEDVDIAETIMNLKMSENVHRAALSSGSRIIQPTLVQFLK